MTIGGVMSGLGGMANLTTMSMARMHILDMLSTRMLSPVIESAVQTFRSDASRVHYGNAGIAQILTALASQCRLTKRCLFRKIPVLVNGRTTPETSRHIWDALRGNGGTNYDVPYPLSFVLIRNSKRDDVKPSVRNTSVRCGNRPLSYDCDEYPYASTFNGGNAMYELGGVSLRAVPESDNRRQGNRLGTFYRRNKITTGKPFINLAIPIAPYFYIDKHGNAHAL